MLSPYKIIFIHGYTSSSKRDWYPQISKELDKLHIDYVIPNLPGLLRPHAQEWLKIINQEVIRIDKPIVLVGHSLGTRAVLLYLEKYQIKIEKVFLISAFANRIENAKRREGIAYPDFFEHKININIIKPLVKEFIVLHSTDDDAIPYEQGVEIAKDLGAKLITVTDRKHFVHSTNAPYILDILKKELKF